MKVGVLFMNRSGSVQVDATDPYLVDRDRPS